MVLEVFSFYICLLLILTLHLTIGSSKSPGRRGTRRGSPRSRSSRVNLTPRSTHLKFKGHSPTRGKHRRIIRKKGKSKKKNAKEDDNTDNVRNNGHGNYESSFTYHEKKVKRRPAYGAWYLPPKEWRKVERDQRGNLIREQKANDMEWRWNTGKNDTELMKLKNVQADSASTKRMQELQKQIANTLICKRFKAMLLETGERLPQFLEKI